MNSKQFLILGGLILAILGILGSAGILGPTIADSIFKDGWWFSPIENWAHIIVGLAALLSAFTLPKKGLRWAAISIGIVGLFFGIYNFGSTSFKGISLESPSDLALHLIIGVWALWAAFNKRWGSNKSN